MNPLNSMMVPFFIDTDNNSTETLPYLGVGGRKFTFPHPKSKAGT
jgi:hypothetical protein